MSPTRTLTHLLLACLIFATAGCDTLAGLFNARSTRLIITNETDFAASPEIRTSASRNILEDSFAAGSVLSGIGDNGLLAPGQTDSITLDCEELEMIAIDGATFEDPTFGFPLGDTSDARTLRRDTDFDCGDTIRIRISGTLFNYSMAASVEESSDSAGNNDDGDSNDFNPFGGQSTGDGDTSTSDDDDDDDIADELDELFN